MMVHNCEFAVVDVETTGLFPRRADRIIEVAIIRVDSHGKTLDEYVTLVNPQRDIGPTHLHGITTRHVKKAPTFDEIAGDVLARLAGAVFVAHNASFDIRFLQAELDRLELELPDFPHLCTMQLARKADPRIPSRRLLALCEHFGITVDRWHSAHADARATVDLFRTCIAKVGDITTLSLSDIGVRDEALANASWPSLPMSGKSCSREVAAQIIAAEPSYIARLVARLPSVEDVTPGTEEYFSLLDRVLEDRRVTAEDAEALFSLAEEQGLVREQTLSAHRRYMREVIRVALMDSALSELEMNDLDEVRRMLNLSVEEYVALFDEVDSQARPADACRNICIAGERDVQGMSVCFTGELACRIGGDVVTRGTAERIAIERGMVVMANVTRELDYLVVADPDSMSGKAKKARAYGVRIIAEPVFWQMMRVQAQ
ncbi:MAG: exonuclease domain-containing protein [Planctomycetota bacterium]